MTKLFNSLNKVAGYLAQIKEQLIQYNNVIIGDLNDVNGNHDIVIGSRNSLTGNNIWVLNSDVHKHNVEDGVLIVGGYVIELNDIN